LPDTVLAVAAVVEDVDDPDAEDELEELPPQAVASVHSAASATSHWKRFIDTLRSRFDVRRLVAGTVRVWLASPAAGRAAGSPGLTVPELI
jgi:hypothetical protein